MTDKPFDDNMMAMVNDYINANQENRDIVVESANKERDTFRKLVLTHLGLLSAEVAQNFRVTLMLMKTANSFGDSLDQLPKTAEFAGVRTEIESIKQKVAETLEPIRKEIEEAQQRDKRGSANPAVR